MDFDVLLNNYLGNDDNTNLKSKDQTLSDLFRQSFSQKPPKNKRYLNNLPLSNNEKIPFYVTKREDQILTGEDFFKYLLHNQDNLFENVDNVFEDDKGTFFQNQLRPTDVGQDYNNLTYMLKGLKRKSLPRNTLWTDYTTDKWLAKKFKTDPNNPQVKKFKHGGGKIEKEVNNNNASSLYKDPDLLNSLNLFTQLRQKDERLDDKVLANLRDQVNNIPVDRGIDFSLFDDINLPEIPTSNPFPPFPKPNIFQHDQEPAEPPSKLDILRAQLESILPQQIKPVEKENFDGQKNFENVLPISAFEEKREDETKVIDENLLNSAMNENNQPFYNNVDDVTNVTKQVVRYDGVNGYPPKIDIEQQFFNTFIDQKDGTVKIDPLAIPMPETEMKLVKESFTSLFPGEHKPPIETIGALPEQQQQFELPEQIKSELEQVKPESVVASEEPEIIETKTEPPPIVKNIFLQKTSQPFSDLLNNIVASNSFIIPQNILSFLQSFLTNFEYYEKLFDAGFTVENEHGTLYHNGILINSDLLRDFISLLTDPSNAQDNFHVRYSGNDDAVFIRSYSALQAEKGFLDVDNFPFWKMFAAVYNDKVSDDKTVLFRNKLKTALDDVKHITLLSDTDKQSKQILRTHYEEIKGGMPQPVQSNIDKFIHFLCSVDSPISMKEISDRFGISINVVNGEVFDESMPTGDTLESFVFDNSKQFAEEIPFVHDFYGDKRSFDSYVSEKLRDTNLTKEDIEFFKSYYWKYVCSMYNSFVQEKDKVTFKHSVTKSKEYDYITLYKSNPNNFLKTLIHKNFDLSKEGGLIKKSSSLDSINVKFRKSLFQIKESYKEHLSGFFLDYSRFLENLDKSAFETHFGPYDIFFDEDVYYGTQNALRKSPAVIKIIQEFVRNNKVFPGGEVKQLVSTKYPYKTVDKFQFIEDFTDNFENDFSFLSTCFYFLPTFLSYLPYMYNGEDQKELNTAINQAIIELHHNFEYDSLRNGITSSEELERCMMVIKKTIFGKGLLNPIKVSSDDNDDNDSHDYYQTPEKILDMKPYRLFFGSNYSDHVMSIKDDTEKSVMSIIDDDDSKPKSIISMMSAASYGTMSDMDAIAMRNSNVEKKEMISNDFDKIENGAFYKNLFEQLLAVCENIASMFIVEREFHSVQECQESLEMLKQYLEAGHYFLAEFHDERFRGMYEVGKETLTKNYERAFTFINENIASIQLFEMQQKQDREYRRNFYRNPDNEYVYTPHRDNIVKIESDRNSVEEMVAYQSEMSLVLDEVKKITHSIIKVEDSDDYLDKEEVINEKPANIWNEWKTDAKFVTPIELSVSSELNRENLEKLPSKEYKQKLDLWLKNEQKFTDAISVSSSVDVSEDQDTLIIERAKKEFVESMKSVIVKAHVIIEKAKMYKAGEMLNQLTSHMLTQMLEFKDNAFFLIKSSFKRPSTMTDYVGIYESACLSLFNVEKEVNKILETGVKNQYLEDSSSTIANIKYEFKRIQANLHRLIEEYKKKNLYGEVFDLETQYESNELENVSKGVSLKQELIDVKDDHLVVSDLVGPVGEDREKINKNVTNQLVGKVELFDLDDVKVTDSDLIAGNVFYSLFTFDDEQFLRNYEMNKEILSNMNEAGMLEHVLQEYLELLFYFHTGYKINWTLGDMEEINYDFSKSIHFNLLSFIFRKLLQMKMSSKIFNVKTWALKINSGFRNLYNVFKNKLTVDTKKLEPLENILDFQKSVLNG